MRLNSRFCGDQIDASVFIAPGAVVLGDVVIGAGSSIWFNDVVRGDTETIRIGRGSNIQDLCVLHADAGVPCNIGDSVTLGHGAIVHGATIEDDCLIGMRAVVLNGAVIGTGSLIAVGAVITEGTRIPPGSVVMGVPGKIVRQVTEKDRERIAHAARHYVDASRQYHRSGLPDAL
jgi:carbonic anhydrase/acetyltransferase-like protein (isoleucine patch superfamily)